MDHGILDPGEALERLAAWKDRIDKLAADTQAMSEQLQDVRITVSDPNGLTEITIDSTGALVDLTLTDRMHQTTPAQVAQTILATLGDARSRLADRSQEIVAETVGTESPTGRAIVDSVGQHLREDTRSGHGDRTDDGDEGYDIDSAFKRR